jgi:chemotaxis signal transduction protein
VGEGRVGKVVFELGGSSFEIGPESVRAVTKVKEVIPCERGGTAVCGLVKVKGRPVPVYDVAQLLGCQRSAQTSKSRLIVTEGDSGIFAFVVDKVARPEQAPAKAVVEIPDIARLI